MVTVGIIFIGGMDAYVVSTHNVSQMSQKKCVNDALYRLTTVQKMCIMLYIPLAIECELSHATGQNIRELSLVTSQRSAS